MAAAAGVAAASLPLEDRASRQRTAGRGGRRTTNTIAKRRRRRRRRRTRRSRTRPQPRRPRLWRGWGGRGDGGEPPRALRTLASRGGRRCPCLVDVRGCVRTGGSLARAHLSLLCSGQSARVSVSPGERSVCWLYTPISVGRSRSLMIKRVLKSRVQTTELHADRPAPPPTAGTHGVGTPPSYWFARRLDDEVRVGEAAPRPPNPENL
jgi:hypothetical protein